MDKHHAILLAYESRVLLGDYSLLISVDLFCNELNIKNVHCLSIGGGIYSSAEAASFI